jgi:hypothetical protein
MQAAAPLAALWGILIWKELRAARQLRNGAHGFDDHSVLTGLRFWR